jgi:hypothetical protein
MWFQPSQSSTPRRRPRERLEQAGLDELGDPEAVEAHDVGAGADREVERVLLLERLVGAAELDELDGDAGVGGLELGMT